MIQIDDLRGRLIGHPLYARIRDEQALRVFMRAHVFCVWDFMALLKQLQRTLTCVESPWFPAANRDACRFINDTVVAEESDVHPGGGYASHYELYHEAMRACGADTGPVDRFLARVRAGREVEAALDDPGIPAGVRAFVGTIFAFLRQGDAHRIAAAFTYGREDVIPDMFRRLVATLAARAPASWNGFLYYLDRHIEVDGDHHGPLAHRLVATLCGDDLQKRREAEAAARQALEARIALWDAILADIEGGAQGETRTAVGAR